MKLFSNSRYPWRTLHMRSSVCPILFLVTLFSIWRPIECFDISRCNDRVISNGLSLPLSVPPTFSTLPRQRSILVSMQTDDSRESSNYGNKDQTTLRRSGKKNAVIEEAEKLRQRAKELMNEANTAEVALRSSKQEADDMKNSKLDDIYDDLQIILNPLEEAELDSTDAELSRRLANILREKRLSSVTMEQLVVRLYERSLSAEKRIRNSNGIEIDQQSDNAFNIGDVSNSIEYNETELSLIQWWIERIIDAQSLLDKDANKNAVAPVLQARIRNLKRGEEEIYQRKLALKLNGNQVQLNSDGTLVNSFAKQTMGEQNVTIIVDGKEISGPKVNITRLMEDITQVPTWVPSSILPFLVVSEKEIDPEIFKKIRSEVLGGSCFNVENCDYTRKAAIYRGSFVDKQRASLYGTSSIALSDNEEAGGGLVQEKQSAAVFREAQERLEQAGLAEEIQLFLMEDPEWRPGDREPEPLPSILAVSINVIPEQDTERGNANKFATGLAIVSTFISTFAYAISGFALNPRFFNAVVNNNDISRLSSCLPIFLGVIVVSAVHELAHRIAATKSGMKIALPVPLPSLQVGTFGSITALRSFPKSRSAMFDFAMSGPIAGAIISIAFMIAGISLTVQASPEALSTFAVVPAAITKTSFLVGTITSVMAPKVMSIPASQLIPIHPIFLVGFAGLVSSALNLLPMGRLDGGRACTAIFGRRSSYIVSFATLLFLAIAAITQTSAISIFWGLLVTLFQRNADIPMRDELSDVDDIRVGVYISCIVLTILTLAPFPGGPIL